jgi:hypothetical protein
VADLITLCVYVLATTRGIQFVTADKLTDKARRWWLRKHPKDTLPGYLIVCAWCTSVYLAVFPAVSWVVAPEHKVLKSMAAVAAFSWLATGAHKLVNLLDVKIKLYSPAPEAEVSRDGEGAAVQPPQ